MLMQVIGLVLCVIFFACKSTSSKKENNDIARISADTFIYSTVAFEELVSAHKGDSVLKFLQSHSEFAFQTANPQMSHFFPVKIGRFIGLLSYKPTIGFSYRTSDWSGIMLEGVGRDFQEVYRPIFYKDYRNFVDSLSSFHKIETKYSGDTTEEEVSYYAYTDTVSYSKSIYSIRYNQYNVHITIGGLEFGAQ